MASLWDSFMEQFEEYTQPKVLKRCLKKFCPRINADDVEKVEEYVSNLSFFKDKNLKDYNFITVSNCKFIDLKYKDAKGPVWYFGSHSKPKKNDILVGYLKTVHPNYPVFILKDSSYSITAVISSEDKSQINSFLYNFIIIKNFRVFTEIYNYTDDSNHEYLYFNSKDVEIIKSQHLQFEEKVEMECGQSNEEESCKFKFLVVRKSLICLSIRNSHEVWLEIIAERNGRLVNELMCLGPSMINKGLMLNIGQKYILHHFNKCKAYQNAEAQRVKPHLYSFIVEDKSAYFEIVDENPTAEIILNIDQALDNLTKYNKKGNLFSFKGKISNKLLVKENSSRTSFKSPLGFGTAGNKTHVLEFLDTSGTKTLTLYLNNWERLQLPFGLLPEMEILVRNVLSQSGRYYKSTAFTNFEIIDYKPRILFDTVNLYPEDEIFKNKDVKFCSLGYGNILPDNILILTAIHFLRIRSLNMNVTCEQKCRYECKCDINNRIINLKMTCYIKDEVGEVIVINHNLELLRLVLGIFGKNWLIWCNDVKSKIPHYTYEKNFDEHPPMDRSFYKKFSNTLDCLIDFVNMNKKLQPELVIKCRKMKKLVDPMNDDSPVWYCIDAKPISYDFLDD